MPCVAAVDASEVLLDHLLDRQLRGTSRVRAPAPRRVQSLAPFLRAIPDAIERADYLRRLAARLDLPLAAVQRATAGQTQPRPEEPPSPTGPQSHFSAESVDTVSRTLIGVLTAFPGLVERIEPAHLDELPSGAGREILHCFVSQARERDPQAILRLMSPERRSARARVARRARGARGQRGAAGACRRGARSAGLSGSAGASCA